MSQGPPRAIELSVNGISRTVTCDPATPLLYILRNDLGLNGPKFGCGLGECGACTILVERRAVRSCVMPVGNLGTQSVTTLEGLGSRNDPGPVQAAFIAEQAAQCGYCLNGMIMTAHAFLSENCNVGAAEVATALQHNLCRCGTHVEIVRAVLRAAATMRNMTAR